MEEASLDDFFAKKDKSKKKSKSSKVIASDILETTDEPVKKDKKKKVKEKTQTSTNTKSDSNTIGITEEEWKEVEEEAEKDYSGLRIANLQVTEKENEETEEQTEENVEEEDDDGEGKKKRDTGQQGPWVKSDNVQQPPVTPKPAVEPQPEETPKEESKPTTGKYIPPSQRGAAAAGGGGATPGPTIPAHLRRKKAAPNLRSEEDFPTLGGGPMPVQQDSDPRSFERVQHGVRQLDDPTKSSQQLSLGNKFSALQD